jgi:signal transduction histidine kinase
MRLITFSIILFLTTSVVQAQSFQIERLKKQIREHPQQDTFRVNRLNEICNTNPRVSTEEMEKFSAEALSLARKLNYTRGEGYALLVSARVANFKGNKELAATLLQQTDSIAKQTGDQTLLWWVLLRTPALSNHYRIQVSGALKSEVLARQLNNSEFISRSQNLASSIYFALGEYALAMEYGIKAMKNAEALNEPNVLYGVYDNISSIYSLIGEYDKANVYLQKLPALIKQLGLGNDPLANLFNALGENARFAKKFPEAIGYYEQSIVATSNEYSIAIANSNLADVYVSMDSLPLAFHYAALAKAGFKNANRTDADSWVESILGRAYFKKNMPDSALYYAMSGYKSANETGIMEDLLSTSKTLADAFAFKNDFKNAYLYFNRYISARDSILGAEVKNKTTVLEHNYEMEKKEDQIALLSEQKKRQKNFLASALVVLGLILISVFLLLRNNRQKQKANKLLQQQKLEIDEKASELALQKDNLEKSYNNVELLGEIGRKVTSSLSVDNIIGTVYHNVNALMDASIFGIGIYHDDTKAIDFPATYENGKALPAYSNSIHDQNRLAGLCFISGKEIVISDLSTEYGNYLQNIPNPIEGGQPASLIYLPLKVKEKMFGVITVQSFSKNAFSDYHLYMLRTIAIYAAIALENAESYKKLNLTVDSLQKTQTQLIQSEKMASLGELTAGIAHEIQNPLNFVNNFSEVNIELIKELKTETGKGNAEEILTIINDIEFNSGKINHHGKRADAIVKGMLQHSRTSSGQKEPTDINSLADEYLRLAYHGLRAKDKSFNAALKTDFDQSIGNINIIPQDIGRVVLNIINNAFFAVDEKKKLTSAGTISNGYEPTVTVSTERNNGNVQIRVGDNGNGISEKVVDKIFQPFFTTKPTGQGTGLGLSLSYDIVKAHDGELKVVTKEGKGSEFIIQLPIH